MVAFYPQFAHIQLAGSDYFSFQELNNLHKLFKFHWQQIIQSAFPSRHSEDTFRPSCEARMEMHSLV